MAERYLCSRRPHGVRCTDCDLMLDPRGCEQRGVEAFLAQVVAHTRDVFGARDSRVVMLERVREVVRARAYVATKVDRAVAAVMQGNTEMTEASGD